jgi:hypothetical protein
MEFVARRPLSKLLQQLPDKKLMHESIENNKISSEKAY